VHNLRLVSLKKNIIALKPSIYRHYNVFFVKSQGVFNSSVFNASRKTFSVSLFE
jgi:hypothetical protein